MNKTQLSNIKKELKNLQQNLSPLFGEELKKIWLEAKKTDLSKEQLNHLKSLSQEWLKKLESELKSASQIILEQAKLSLKQMTEVKTPQRKTSNLRSANRSPAKKKKTQTKSQKK